MLKITNINYCARVINITKFEEEGTNYEFSYPILNTSKLCQVLKEGGAITFNANKLGDYTFSFDKEKSILIAENPKTKDICNISNVAELYNKICDYYYENAQELEYKVIEANEKRSKAQLGNKNARKKKDDTINKSDIPQQPEQQNNRQEDKSSEGAGISNQHGSEIIQNQEVNIDKLANKEPKEFCQYRDYVKIVENASIEDYFYLIIKNDWEKKIDNGYVATDFTKFKIKYNNPEEYPGFHRDLAKIRPEHAVYCKEKNIKL